MIETPASPETPTAAWRSRILESGTADPASLTANPRNWRAHPPDQQGAMAQALDQVGWVQQVIVNRRTGLLVDGHLRVELAQARGETAIPVLYVDLSDEEEALVLASLDPLAAMADTDGAKLRDLLAGVTIGDGELATLLASLAPEKVTGKTDPDDAPDVPLEPYVKPGELWLLGEHRLLCGDATSEDDVARLMAGTLASCVWTDPPYGVAYVGKTKRRLEIENDERDDDGLEALLRAALGLALDNLELGRGVYVASPSDGRIFVQVLADLGVYRQTLVWVKDSFVLSRSDYHFRHEFIQYGWRPGAHHYFTSDRTLDTVIEVPRPKASTTHPTMKPVDLVAQNIEHSTKAREVVLDPFVGSGTTIIAAEQLGRRAYAMEIDPRYVQVALERWQAFTGREATRA